VSPSPHMKTETDPVSEMLGLLVFRIPDAVQVQKPSDSELCFLLFGISGDGQVQKPNVSEDRKCYE
jgi:hypothetical protein